MTAGDTTLSNAALRAADSPLREALGACRGDFLAVGLFSLVINGLVLAVPLYMLQIYDRVLTSRSADTLLMLTLLVVGLLAVNGLLELVRSRVLVRVGTRLDARLNGALFSAALSNRLAGHEGSGSQPLRDLESLRAFLTGGGLLAFFDSPWTPLFIVVIFLFHPLLGGIALGGAIMLFALAVLIEMATRRPLNASGRETMRAHEFAEASLRNSEAIEAMGMLPGLKKRWLERHQAGLALHALAGERAGTLNAAARVIRPMLQIAILGTGALLAIEQVITPGVMIASSIILARALAPVEVAIGSWRNFVAARGARQRLDQLLVDQPGPPDRMSLPKPVGRLSVEGVVARPPGSPRTVLRGVSFKLEPGEALGLIGPSAAGKSTLARLMTGVWKPAAGSVRLDGAEVSEWNREALGPHIGYLPQDVELFDGTVSDNICRFSEPDPGQVVDAAKLAGAHEMILRLPEGYDTLIGEAGGVLSAGQRQRVGLARALYGDPMLIVLDEPNASLDTEGEEALREALKHIKAARKTAVVISHRTSILSSVDKLLVLRGGRVEMFGPRPKTISRVSRGASSHRAKHHPDRAPILKTVGSHAPSSKTI